MNLPKITPYERRILSALLIAAAVLSAVNLYFHIRHRVELHLTSVSENRPS